MGPKNASRAGTVWPIRIPLMRASRHNKRGSVLVGVLVALLLVGLVVIGLTASGSRIGMSGRSNIDGMRALYATEAGMNMAVREVYANSDDDGDGVIGSISSDGNSNNDPDIGGAKVWVSKTTAGSVITIKASGRAGQASKSMEATLE